MTSLDRRARYLMREYGVSQAVAYETVGRGGFGVCRWFALCDHQATSTMPHPILGAVPICDRCRKNVEAMQ